MVLLKHMKNEVKFLKDKVKDLQDGGAHQWEVIDMQIEECFNLSYITTFKDIT